MKVSIISDSFYESTFPLAKHLAVNIPIDLYCVVQKTFLNPSMLDITEHEEVLNCGILSSEESYPFIPKHVQKYFQDSNISLRLVVFSGGTSYLKDLATTFRFSRLLKKENYSLYHFIGTYVLFPLIENRLAKSKIIHTLHESSDRILMLDKNRIKHFLFKRLFRLFRRTPIRLIFHSENVRREYHKTYSKPLSQTTVIPFGLFEGYRKFSEIKDLKLPGKKYLLFVGYIHPYKGVDLLMKVAEKLADKNLDIPIVIAGKDATNLEGRFAIPENVTLINKYLSENELVTLIKKCHSIVLPYTSSSQSGIPNTGFCFNKPIIASDLDGIKDIVKHDTNGLLFKNGDIGDLEDSIVKLWQNKELYERLIKNIKNKVNLDWMDWEKISQQTEKWYNLTEN